MLKKDFFLAGVVIGCVLPLIIAAGITFVNLYFLGNTGYDIYYSKTSLILCFAPNVLLFRFLMVNFKKFQMGKGLLLVTILFIFLILMKP